MLNPNSVDSINIEGFKSIRELSKLKLMPLNILIGANGSGKSNFISVFNLINHIVQENLQIFVGKSGGADNLLYFGQKITDRLKIDITFGKDTNGYQCALEPAEKDTLVFSEERCWFHDKTQYPKPYDESLGAGHKETKLQEVSKYRSMPKYVLEALKSWKLYHFHDTSDFAKVKLMGEIHDNQYLRPDASNLAAFLYLLKNKSQTHYQNIIDTIRLVAPFFQDFILEPSRLNPSKIQLEWKHLATDQYFGPAALSDGTLRFICLTTLLLQPTLPTTILLDEPELGLHPYAINLLASLLKSTATKTQIIVSTQSVTLVNQFKPENIIVVENDQEQSIFKRLSEQDMKNWLNEYGLGDLWEKNIFGGRP